jgi:fermentation-respiration switch protein FrsA (DUF1100 family)
MRRFVKIAAITATTIVGVLGVIWTAQRKLIYFPTQDVGEISAVLPSAEEVTYTTQDGLTLFAWWVPAEGSAVRSTIVVFHGNGGNRTDRADLARGLVARGFNVLLTDYRGYGGNQGRPSEAGLLLDARAGANYAAERADVASDELIYFGESLGSGVAIALSQEMPPAALVLRSPFTSLGDVASVHYPFVPGWLLKDRYPNIDIIAGLEVPVLVVAGSADTIIPIEQSRAVFDAAQGVKRLVVIDGADHNDAVLSYGPRLIDEVESFIGDVASTR